MTKIERKGVEEARNLLPKLIEAAEAGRTTVITRRGKAVAALVPLDSRATRSRQQSLLSVAGSGRGLWGSDSAREVGRMRDEWSR